MASTITNFLIGIGFDFDESTEKKVKAAMEGVKSSTLAIGAVMASAAIGAGMRVDQLAEKSRKLQDQLYRTNTSTTWVQGYGASLTQLGGSADDAVGRVTGLEERLAAIRMGDRGWLDTLGPAGFDSGALAQAKSAQDFITMAAEQFSKATHTQQVNMANVLGLTDAEFKLWQQGGQYVDAHSKSLAEQLGYTTSLNEQQYEYSQSWVALNLEMDKAGNTLSQIMLPSMTSLVGKANEYVGTLNKLAQENPEAAKTTVGAGVAAGVGAAIFGSGKILGAIPGLGALGRAAGPAGAVVGGGLLANEGWDALMENRRQAYGDKTTAGGNLRKDSPLGKAYDWIKSQTVTSGFEANSPDWMQKPTHGADYAPYTFRPDYNASATGTATGNAVTTSMPKIENKLNMSATVELNGQKLGEFVDVRIDQNQQQAMQQFDTRVSR